MALKLITPAAAPVVTTAAAKAFLRVEGTEEDVLIADLVAAATEHLQLVTGRAFATQVWELYQDDFADAIPLAMGPVQSIDEVGYFDVAGAPQLVGAEIWDKDLVSDPAWLLRRQAATWPLVVDAANAVRIRFTAGYATCPAPLRQAVLLLTGHWYTNREAVITGTIASELPLGVQTLIHNYRVWLA